MVLAKQSGGGGHWLYKERAGRGPKGRMEDPPEDASMDDLRGDLSFRSSSPFKQGEVRTGQNWRTLSSIVTEAPEQGKRNPWKLWADHCQRRNMVSTMLGKKGGKKKGVMISYPGSVSSWGGRLTTRKGNGTASETT